MAVGPFDRLPPRPRLARASPGAFLPLFAACFCLGGFRPCDEGGRLVRLGGGWRPEGGFRPVAVSPAGIEHLFRFRFPRCPAVFAVHVAAHPASGRLLVTASELPAAGEAPPGDSKLLGLSADRYVRDDVVLPLPRDASDWSAVLGDLQAMQDLVATHLIEPLAADAGAIAAERGEAGDGRGPGGRALALAGAGAALALALLAGSLAARRRKGTKE